MFPGDAVSLFRSPINLDRPSVGVDLCSVNPLPFCCQKDKSCPQVQQGHPGIHEKESASQSSLSVRLLLLPWQSAAASPYSSKVERWPGQERTEPAINTNMAFLTGSLSDLNYILQIPFRKQSQNCSKNKQQHTHRRYHASYLAHCQLSNQEKNNNKCLYKCATHKYEVKIDKCSAKRQNCFQSSLIFRPEMVMYDNDIR